jgi:hypothetical protein
MSSLDLLLAYGLPASQLIGVHHVAYAAWLSIFPSWAYEPVLLWILDRQAHWIFAWPVSHPEALGRTSALPPMEGGSLAMHEGLQRVSQRTNLRRRKIKNTTAYKTYIWSVPWMSAFSPWLAIEHIQVLCRPGELAEGSELRCCQ